MASRPGKKGKSKDLSTPWSEFAWDERGFFFASRYNESGDLEYIYKGENAEPTPEQRASTPRSIPEPENYTPAEDTQTQLNASPTNNLLYTTSRISVFPPENAFSLAPTTPVETLSNQLQYTTLNENPASNANISPSRYPAAVGPRPLGSGTARSSSTYNYAAVGRGTSSPASPSWAGQTSSASDDGMNSAGIERSPSISSVLAGTTREAIANSKVIRRQGSKNFEQLDNRYCAVPNDQQSKFWRVGRVFMVLWTEPARDSVKGSSHISEIWLGGKVFSEIRRFVVVREGYGHSICSPINTYNNQACLKPNLPDVQSHAIIYTQNEVPPENRYRNTDGTIVRENLIKDPVKVRRELKDPEGDLGQFSRINYAKIYTVENYVRVLNIGMVSPESMQSFQHDNMFGWGTGIPQPPRNRGAGGGSNRGGRSGGGGGGKGKGREEKKDTKGREPKTRETSYYSESQRSTVASSSKPKGRERKYTDEPSRSGTSVLRGNESQYSETKGTTERERRDSQSDSKHHHHHHHRSRK